ncbi:MAG: choice-of-anchor D domain-containing protein [Chloroflexi bacterium]|nr:choice-of-anchor D domain-containing protein [Chloroflexota bacterium]
MSKCAARARRVLAGAVALGAVFLCGASSARAASLSGDALDFTTQRVATTSTTQAITITNSGTATTALSFVIIGTNAGDFNIVSSPGSIPGIVMDPANTGDVVIEFTPGVEGTRNAQLEVTYSVPTDTVFTIRVTAAHPDPQPAIKLDRDLGLRSWPTGDDNYNWSDFQQ